MKKADLYYTGTVVEVLDKVLYEIKVDIPGIKSGVKAFPFRGEVDEPRVGDFVLLKCLDPVFQSYYLYQKIKENDFIGFRSNGKMVDITPDYIKVAVYDPGTEYNDPDNNPRPVPSDLIEITKDGVLNISMRSDGNVYIGGNCTVHIGENCNIEVMGNCNATVHGKTNIETIGSTVVKGSDVTLKGPGTLTVKGKVVAGGHNALGPFVLSPTFLAPGSPIPTSDTLLLES